jgi:hypothetical protein
MVPVIKSSFLPPSMTRKARGFSASGGPLTTLQASEQLVQELTGLPDFVKWEMFRLVNALELATEDILLQKKELRALRKACQVAETSAKNEDMVQVIHCIGAFLPPEKRKTFLIIKPKVWQALKEEKKLLDKGDWAQIGNPKDMTDKRYGGKVRFGAKLSVDKDKDRAAGRSDKGPHLIVELKAPAVAVSNANRLTKLYGSESFLCLKIDDPSLKRVPPLHILNSLSEGIRLGGDLFHAWFIKDGTVLFVNTAIGRRIEETMDMDADEFFLWFVDRHNPPDMNQKQTVGKWGKRMQLLWSASIPGPRLEAENIKMIEDEGTYFANFPGIDD